MCGIVGQLAPIGKRVDNDSLIAARDMMIHRGPDDFGLWISEDQRVALGHRRLSIVDLSPMGHQPFVSECGSWVITFNGELYNFRDIRKDLMQLGHVFKSECDTEVILHSFMEWGEKCLDRFIGMFAFAIWDAKSRRLFVARDRLGVKPLFYYSGPHGFAFSSRLSPLLKFPFCTKEIEPDGLGLYLECGFVPAPWSMIRGIRKLQPGHYLSVTETTLADKEYWTIDSIRVNKSLLHSSRDDLVEALDTLLRDSIRLRMLADVPVGAFLSGGIDSTLVVALIREITGTPPKTFSIGFHDKMFDESSHAARVATFLNTDHQAITMDSTNVLSLLGGHEYFYDEPLADWSTLPMLLVSTLARSKVKVCLSGDGGDELFGGYNYYRILRAIRYLFHLPLWIRTSGGRILSHLAPHRAALLGELFTERNVDDSFAFMRSINKGISRGEFASISGISLRELLRKRASTFPEMDDVSRASRLDIAYYLADDILNKVDAASMATSLEAREPLLDHRIVEFACSLPVEWKLHKSRSKFLLREVLSKYVPRTLYERPKQGFVVPLNSWIRGDLREMVQDVLSTSAIRRFGYLSEGGIDKILKLHMSGKRDTHPIIWSIFQLLRWSDSLHKYPSQCSQN